MWRDLGDLADPRPGNLLVELGHAEHRMLEGRLPTQRDQVMFVAVTGEGLPTESAADAGVRVHNASGTVRVALVLRELMTEQWLNNRHGIRGPPSRTAWVRRVVADPWWRWCSCRTSYGGSGLRSAMAWGPVRPGGDCDGWLVWCCSLSLFWLSGPQQLLQPWR